MAPKDRDTPVGWVTEAYKLPYDGTAEPHARVVVDATALDDARSTNGLWGHFGAEVLPDLDQAYELSDADESVVTIAGA